MTDITHVMGYTIPTVSTERIPNPANIVRSKALAIAKLNNDINIDVLDFPILLTQLDRVSIITYRK